MDFFSRAERPSNPSIMANVQFQLGHSRFVRYAQELIAALERNPKIALTEHARRELLWYILCPQRSAWERLYLLRLLKNSSATLWHLVWLTNNRDTSQIKDRVGLTADGVGHWEVAPMAEEVCAALEFAIH